MAFTGYATLFSAGHRLAAKIAARWMYSLSDRTVLPAHPAFRYAGSINSSESDTIRQKILGLKSRRMTQIADGAAVVPTTYARTYVDVVIAPYRIATEYTDLAKLTDVDGEEFAIMTIVDDLFQSYNGALLDAAAQLLDTFGTPIGTSGNDNTLANVMTARTTLAANDNEAGSQIYIGHTQAIQDLIANIVSLGGALQYRQDAQGVAVQNASGHNGTYLDIELFGTTRAPTMNAGADVASALLASDAMLWGDGVAPLEDPTQQMLIGPVLVEREREALAGKTTMVGHGHFGIVELDNLRGLTIQSDAP